ncbi:hypothetical protein PAHAL_7G316300 [Panicum hallii]|jgi:hypothetical protein|uniref:Uncharacterized protein n=2 Tax=Panicum sect. Panicum TaxID=2100772 RepID=A0A3L6PXI0_PANMI|nr:uncharacterized protein LOC112901380 [Panicum hallii]PAN40449.1 hypothetical protein PAHAL_7G316300 [Panicum hallii]RLM65803.1 hypothetical protein C2845_PM16G22080 [Panicum miliaceum]
MAVPVLLLAVPAAAGGFLQAFHLAFLLWPFNAALPLARDLPRACIALRGIASFYAAGLHAYASGARRGVQLLQARSHRDAGGGDDSSAGGVVRTREDAVAHAMMAFDDIY